VSGKQRAEKQQEALGIQFKCSQCVAHFVCKWAAEWACRGAWPLQTPPILDRWNLGQGANFSMGKHKGNESKIAIGQGENMLEKHAKVVGQSSRIDGEFTNLDQAIVLFIEKT